MIGTVTMSRSEFAPPHPYRVNPAIIPAIFRSCVELMSGAGDNYEIRKCCGGDLSGHDIACVSGLQRN
jgi:hypothetical protein